MSSILKQFSLYMWKLLKNSWDATMNDEELIPPDEEDLRFIHQVNFIQAAAESVPQACLSCMILKLIHFEKDPFSEFSNLASLVTSILSLCIAFSKVHLNMSFYS